MRFEYSTDETRCDKEIAWIKSCRECLFDVLCRLQRIRERNLDLNNKRNDNRQNQKDSL